jgi:hypothetical protein
MTDTFLFRPATKEQAKARVALDGPSGSGKTYTALILATVFAAADATKIGVIDTERGSAAKYAHRFTFEHLALHTFSPDTLTKALAAAAEQGFGVVVVDSTSHFWEGTDGMLEQVDNAARRSYGGNSFGGWKDARPMERRMIDALVAYPGHVIVTMRTKSEWVIEQNEKGRTVPRRIGTKPVQREGIEYEFDVVGELDLDNTLCISKTRCEDLAGQVIRKPDDDLAKTILAWLTDGAVMPTVPEYVDRVLAADATADGLLVLREEVARRGLSGAAVLDGTGEATTLVALINRRGRQLLDAETAAAAAADPEPAAS